MTVFYLFVISILLGFILWALIRLGNRVDALHQTAKSIRNRINPLDNELGKG